MKDREDFVTHCSHHLTKLPRNEHGLHYVLQNNIRAVPCVVRFQTRSDRKTHRVSYYQLDTPAIDCMMIFWDQEENEALIAYSASVPNNIKQRAHKTLIKETDYFQMTAKSDIFSRLIEEWTALIETRPGLKDIEEKTLALLDPEQQRLLNKEKYGPCQNLEATTNTSIKELLGDEVYFWATPAGTCAADAGYRSKEATEEQSLGIQLKVANQQKNGRYTFNRCNNYPGMLLMCRPIPQEGPADTFIVIPNAKAPPTINTSFLTVGSDLNKMVVPRDQLSTTLAGIYSAVATGISHYTYPSGERVDVSDLELFSETKLKTPTSAKCKKEHENTLKRERLFPESTFVYPDYQEAYDVMMDGVRLQDKCAEASKNNSGYFLIKIVKNSGNVNGKRTKGPYEVGDFDALWVNLPNSENIFIIPAHELETHKILKTATTPGVTWISCHPPSYQPQRQLKDSIWTDEFFIDMSKPDAKDRVTKILHNVREISRIQQNSEPNEDLSQE